MAGQPKAPFRRCRWCGDRVKTRVSKYCSHVCYGLAGRIRSVDDSYSRRQSRAQNAPGLKQWARLRLMQRWIRQGRTCAYCQRPATEVDHVVPLVRGGTNYEGNLVPCCKRCNCSKAGLFLIEWRTGRRVSRMGYALTLPSPRSLARSCTPKVTRPTVQLALKICPECNALHTRPLYCSTLCSTRYANRANYRARAGIAVDAPLRKTGRRRAAA